MQEFRLNILSQLLIFAWLMGAIRVHAEEVRFQDILIPDQSGKAMTVLGPIDPESLGQTLMHEHLILEYPLVSIERDNERDKWEKFEGVPYPETEEERRHWNAPFTTQNAQIYPIVHLNKDAMQRDSVTEAVEEVLLYDKLGGSTIVDVTSIGLGRNPVKLREIARKSGLNVIMGTGFYIRMSFTNDMERRSVDDLTYEIVSDIVRGADGGGIRSGIIGEIGAESPTAPNQARSLQAAARASRLTGAAITLHSALHRPELWHATLDILEEEGADMSRVVMGHVTANLAKETDFLESLLRRGVCLGFDALGLPFQLTEPPYDTRPIVHAIIELITYGYADRILVSQDVLFKRQLAKHGGWGFTFVHKSLVPYLRSKGINEKDIDTILQENPRRLLTFSEPKQLVNLR